MDISQGIYMEILSIGGNKMLCNDCGEKASIEIDSMNFCEDCADEYQSEE
mgnify:CR=1 FL=1